MRACSGLCTHLFHNKEHILDREDPDAAAILQKRFQEEGIILHLNSTIKRVQKNAEDKLIKYEDDQKKEQDVNVDEILVGAGREPNIESLNLQAVGVQADSRKGVVVDDFLRTTNKDIYAAGDVCMDWKFTHAAEAAARIVLQNALFPLRKRLSSLTMCWCTYTDPEIAHVGLYAKEAEKKGIPTETFMRTFDGEDRAITDGDQEGLIKVHVRKGTDKILGATIVASHAGEMISEVTLAKVSGLGLKSLSSLIHPYPTQSESIRHIADDYNKTRLSEAVKRIFRYWFKLRFG
jgi:pyruvate/2-oxoglutarate dehydrogenase complex dihydrolipoamide dehydrogenase (E3) component